MSCEQNTVQHHNTKTVNKSFENVKHFLYLVTKEPYQNCMHRKLNSGLLLVNAC